jgi:hypothetical protein
MRPEPADSSGTNIPAVSAPSSPVAARKTRDELRAACQTLPLSILDSPLFWNSLTTKHSKHHIIERYLDLPEDTRENIKRVIKQQESFAVNTAMIIVKMLAGSNTSDQMIDDVATYIAGTDTDNLEFIKQMFRSDSETEVQYQPLQIDITGLKYYSLNGFKYNPALPIRKQSEKTQEQIAALFKLHSYSYTLPSYMQSGREPMVTITANNRIEPYWLAQYAVERPDLVDNMIDAIDERGTAREDVIRPVLGTESPAMMQGVL